MPKGGPRGGGRIGRYLRAAGAVASAAYNAARRRMVGPRLPGGQFRSKYAARQLARAAVGLGRRRRRTAMVQNVKPTPGLTSHSQFRLTHRPSPQVRSMKRVGAPNYYITNGALQTIANEGFQNAISFAWQQQVDIQAMSTHVPNNSPPTPGTYRTNKWVLESSQIELMITNSSLASAYVELYDIVRKRDANATEFSFTTYPHLAWQQGEYNAVQGSLSTDWQVINASPFDSQVFRDWFKVVKRTRIELSQGATHRHAVNLKPNKLIDASLINFVDGDYAGLTVYTMVVFKGQPASIPGEAGPVVTTAQVALDIVSGRRYKYTFVQDTTETGYITDNLSTLRGEQIVSTGAGAIVPNAIV